MSYYDKTFGSILPTRSGSTTGAANERQMLDKIGGSAGYRKQFKTNADGTVTMLATKNGMPQFSTYGDTTQTVVLRTDLYLESGQLTWTLPGIGNPTRFNPAAWKFLDISPGADYLGYVKANGQQNNYPGLTDGQESQAIGYRKTVLTATSAAKEIADATLADAARKTAVEDLTVMKKMIAGIFPASLFTGKMRLFMQAQYGALDGAMTYPLSLDLQGESPNLYYTNGDNKIQFGFWSHKTPGIFTAPDGSYWLLDISMDWSGTYVTVYPILHDPSVLAMAKKLKEETLGDSEKAKIEAYVFAYSYINLSSQTHIVAPGAPGATMAYGWKFNADGSKAKVVVHTQSGVGATAKFNSQTVTLSFGYSSGAVSVSGDVKVNGDWMDGWGAYNIFVPERETSTAPLSLVSVTSGFPRPDFGFENVEVYGYFMGDKWVGCVLSKKSSGTAGYTQSNSDRFYYPAQETIEKNYEYSYNLSGVPLDYSSERISSSSEFNLVVGDVLHEGSEKYGVYIERNTTFSGVQGTEDNGVSFPATEVKDGSSPNFGSPPGYSTFNANNEGANHGGFVEWCYETELEKVFTGTRYKRWAFVIPGGDAAAVYVATRQSNGDGSYLNTRVYGRTIVRFFSSLSSFVPYKPSWQCGGWYGFPTYSSYTSSTPDVPADILAVHCYNSVLDGEIGVPGGSYSSLFTVASTYPFYDRGMYTYTSYGGRYAMSEHTNHPISVNYNSRFIGWA